ncbi:thioredoxin family protein [Roseivivax sp. CAU 1753]
MAATPPVCDVDWSAPDFTLPATDGRRLSLSGLKGENGTLVMFICNHCPYVLRVLDRIIEDARALQERGIAVVAICANDAEAYPADSFDNMVKMAETHALPFPYLHDADQSVARAYNAACTPDFFGFNAKLGLQYRGRLGTDRRELRDAMIQIAETGRGPADQVPSMGCSIKWKPA